MRYRIQALAVAALMVAGCTTRVSAIRFEPSSSVRLAGAAVDVVAVRNIQADRKAVAPNQFEFNKAGAVYFEIPIADHFRRCLVREIELSGMKLGSGAQLEVDIKRFHLADKFTSLELYYETQWRITRSGKTVTRDLRAARRHAVYGSAKKANDMNAMVTELYEQFFNDPEVKALLQS